MTYSVVCYLTPKSAMTNSVVCLCNCVQDLVVRLRSLQKARVWAKILELTESGSDIEIFPIPGVSLSTARCLVSTANYTSVPESLSNERCPMYK